MKNNKKAIGIVLTVIMLISVSVAIAPTVSATEAGDLEEIQKAIEGSGAEWQAGYTSVSGLSLEEKQQLCGLKIRESMTMKNMIVSASSVKRSRYDESASSVKRSRYDESATNEGGIASIDTTMEVPKTSSLAGYNIAVVNAGYDPGQVELQLEAWGATVDLINVPAITASLLSSYDLVWIPYAAAGAVDAGGKAPEILSYVENGGGEILAQPGEVMTPQCLPYTWQITDVWYGDACATAILDPTHELTAGLTVDDMPDAFDRSGTVDPAYTILALSGESEPTFGCANYGNGRVIVEMDCPLGPGICDVCDDCPSLSEAMVTRMVEWVSVSQPCDAFDWRDYLGGDWTTSIKDQGPCGSCWAFGSQAAMEAHIDLQKDDPTFNQDLSEQQLLSCSPGDCDGWYEDAVLNWLRDEGTVAEACFPYEADDTIPCDNHCPDWESRIWKITDWGWVAPTIPAITGHLHDAPLVTGMAVYEDFSYYDGGIYEHVWGDLRGYHLVSMVGYDECEDYWICKNSWGPDWGEGGWFRIRFGQCDIENMNAYIEPPIIEPIIEPPLDWGVRLDATCGVGTDVAEFGLNVDATDGFDPEFDEVEPPPPPGDYQQAYFYYPGNPSWCKKLSTSYIPPHQMGNSWPFQLAYSGDPSDVTITWNADDIDAVPPDDWLYFVVDGEWIDMRTTPSYTFSATTGTCDFEILAINAIPFTFELYTGWNMISFPGDPLDKDPDNIFGPGYYQLVTWDPVSGSYVAVDEVETDIGYWLLVTEDRSVTVLVVPIFEYYTGLIQGWNMIGSIFVDTNVPGGTETIPPNQMHPSLYTWNVDHYDTTMNIDSGVGYWALAYNDCELHAFPAPPPPPLSAPSIQQDENNWGVTLDATCGAGTDVAEFGLNVDATDGFDAEFDEVEPPPPPGDHQQAYFRYPGNPSWCRKLSTSYIPHHFIDDVDWNSWPFQLAYSGGDPSDVTITWDVDDIDAVPEKCDLYFVVDGGQIDMRTTPSYTFSATTGTYDFEILAICEIEKPDLVITDKWLCWPDNCTICYNVTNIGEETAYACHNTTLYVDGATVAHDHVPVDLAPGESYIGCFDGYIWAYTPPSDDITVCADNNETVVELDEDNNCLTNIWMCGDVNCDGEVTMSDVVKVFNRYKDPDYPLDLPWAADVYCDDIVTMSDVRKVFNRYLDQGYELNCCCEEVPQV